MLENKINMKVIKVERIVHRNEKRLGLYFERDQAIIDMIRTISGCRWSATKTCWHIPYFEGYTTYLNNKFINKIQFLELNPKVNHSTKGKLQQLEKAEKEIVPQSFFDQLKIKRLSYNTVSAYKSVLTRYLKYCEADKTEPTPQNIQQYLLYMIDKHNISRSYQNQLINAAKIYFEAVLGISMDNVHLTRVKKERKLPVVFSEDEVKLLLGQVKNLKHKCLLSLIYSAGLRRAEVLALKVQDIDSGRNCIIIRGAKGNKDRISLLSDKLLLLLRQYYKEYRPKNYLFEGENGKTIQCYKLT